MKALSPPSVGNSTAEGAERKPSSICATDQNATEFPDCVFHGISKTNLLRAGIAGQLQCDV